MNTDEGWFKKGFKVGCGFIAAGFAFQVAFGVVVVILLVMGTCLTVFKERNNSPVPSVQSSLS